MAEKAWPTDLTREQLRQIYTESGVEEKKLMSDLAKSDNPDQAVVVAELLHYFPGTELTDVE